MLKTRLSLAEQIAQLQDAAPVDFDPEAANDLDGLVGSSTDPAAREHYLTVGSSDLRKLHDDISDPKYDGVKILRRDLLLESEGDDQEASAKEEESQEEEFGGDDSDERLDGADSDTSAETGNEMAEEASDSRHEYHSSPLLNAPESSTTMREKQEDDSKKGKAVVRQLAIWDTLVDARIRLQKAVTTCNSLPSPGEMCSFLSSTECKAPLHRLLTEACELSNELFELQEHLLEFNEGITPPRRKRRKIESDDSTEALGVLEEATRAVSSLEVSMHPYVIQTLAKWSAKVQAVAPSVLLPANRGGFLSRGSQAPQSIAKIIEGSLEEHDKLLARTRTRKTKGSRIGAPAETGEGDLGKEDLELFDDTDFYQQLLRDVISSKESGDSFADDWKAMQKQKRANKRVDIRGFAFTRYQVHEKLQNFMVPVPTTGAWHEEQIDELFASLLGKGFECNVDAVEENEMAQRAEESLKSGFRVFG